MGTPHITYTAIDKNLVHTLQFGQHDVLESENDRREREKQLQKAQTLGNIDKHHVRIRFQNASGDNLETTVTIWAVTNDYVVLKGENLIPIKNITNIKLY